MCGIRGGPSVQTRTPNTWMETGVELRSDLGVTCTFVIWMGSSHDSTLQGRKRWVRLARAAPTQLSPASASWGLCGHVPACGLAGAVCQWEARPWLHKEPSTGFPVRKAVQEAGEQSMQRGWISLLPHDKLPLATATPCWAS